MIQRSKLLIFASACSSTFAPAMAFAQDSTPGASDAARADQDTRSETIVVTATRRAERTLDVPTTIQAFSSETLADRGIDNIDQVGQLSPGVSMTRTGGMINPYIRGVGNRAATPGDENSVSVYVDGVYQMAAFGDYQEINDVERIEVLKGPQGTLSGRNSSGGTINIITPTPSLLESSGSIDATGGKFNYWKANAFFSTPIVQDRLAVNVALTAYADDGYFHNIVSGDDSVGERDFRSARAKFLFQATDNLSLTLSAHTAKAHVTKVNAPYRGNTIARADNPAVVLPTEPMEVALGDLPGSEIKTAGGSLTVTWDLPAFQLVSLTGYEWGRFVGETDSDATANDSQRTFIANQFTSNWSQELRLVSASRSPFRWVVGVYGFWDHSGYDPLYTTRLGNLSSFTVSDLGTDSYAVFGEGTYKFNEAWSLTAGARYTTEKRSKKASSFGVQFVDDSERFSAFTPKLSLQYYVTPKMNFYATYAKGFKSGLYNASSGAIPVKPEHVTSYEVGMKSRDLHWLDIDAAAFYYDFKDLQFSARAEDQTTRLTNAGSAKIYGVEASGLLRPLENLGIQFGVTWLHAEYTSFPTAQVFYPRIVGGVPAGNVGVIEDASGRPMVKTPRWSGSVAVDYSRPTGFGEIGANLSLAYTGKTPWDVSGRIDDDAYTIANAQISFLFRNPGIRATLWARNLFDTHYLDSAVASSAGDVVTYGRPRDFGSTLSYAF